MKQDKALAILKSGTNVFLTGSAGAGKTYVLNQYIDYLKSHKIPVAVTASTGIAATHLNGMTIHSWTGFGIKDALSSSDLAKMKDKKYLQKSIENTKVLIIDEVSMLHRRQFEMVDQVLRFFKDKEDVFGGIQLVLCGDFFQLPPVTDRLEENKDKFAFMSPQWVQANLTICYLTEQYRQTEGKELNDILNEIRNGQISNESVLRLEATHTNNLEGNLTRLFTHNADVDDLNLRQLKALKGKTTDYKARTKGNAMLIESLKKSVLTYSNLPIKKGAKVMFVKNNYEQGYMNGSLGEVVAFTEEENLPLVKLLDGRIITAEEQVWSVDDEKGKPLATFTQIPLRLAWAITVHKSQGMTLDAAEVDLSKTFERGQGYVALSRLKSLEGLKLNGLNLRALESDGLVLKADLRFRELSDESDSHLSIAMLESLFERFIKNNGGTVTAQKIKKTKEKQAKGDTYERTYELILKGYTLDKIAKERGFSPSTIAGHLSRIKAKYPEADLQHFRPEDVLIAKVTEAFQALKAENNPEHYTADGAIKLGVLYGKLNGQISYEDIRLALIFI